MSQHEIVLVTGASSAVGRQIISAIASEKTLILAHCYRSESALRAFTKSLPGQFAILPADFNEPGQTADLIQKIDTQYGAPSGIVHIPAPKFGFHRFEKNNWERFRENIEVQLHSIVDILGSFLPKMAAEKRGKVLFVLSSVTFGVPPRGLAHYATVKYGLLGLMKSLAAEFAPRNISVNALSPSMMETPFLSELPAQIAAQAVAKNPRGRNATPADVAAVARFFLSDDAGFITGVNLPISGGENF